MPDVHSPFSPDPQALTPRVLSTRAAARYLGDVVTAGTMANRRSRGIGPRFLRTGKAGSRVAYLVSDLDDWLANRDSGTH